MVKNIEFRSFEIHSPVMKAVYDELEDFAANKLNCLLHGPTGSGKEFLARHYYEIFRQKHRDAGDFYDLNCAGISSELAQSELFGHVAGAFTDAKREKRGIFELAANGVLFLDEIGGLPREVQSMLLRALDPGEAKRLGADSSYKTQNVTVIGATDSDPAKLMPQLLYRLGHVITVPGLDDRPEDLRPATKFFIDKVFSEMNREHLYQQNKRLHLPEYAEELKEKILSTLFPLVKNRKWSGNFRVLYNTLQAAIIRADYTASERETLEEIRDFFNQYADRSSTLRKKKETDPRPELIALLNDKFPRWKKDERVKWAEILTDLGEETFMRSHLEASFDMAPRTLQNRLGALVKNGILSASGNKNDLYNLIWKDHPEPVHSGSKTPLQSSCFDLPEANVDPLERKQEVNDIINLFARTDHLFLSGEKGGGKTTAALLVGKEMMKNRDVYYFELDVKGFSAFLQELTGFLIDKGYASLRGIPFFRPFMLSTDAAALSGFVDHYFRRRKEPVFILDNLHMLKSREDLDALQVIMKYWQPVKFIFTGTKLSNELIFGEEVRILEYPIISAPG